ncbi:unnamed protein product [Debaryomyces fabryi]|nr:unnamed protein product [Debaryomyces fabryi]
MPSNPSKIDKSSRAVHPPTSTVPVPGAVAGSNTSISTEIYTGMEPTACLMDSTILALPKLSRSRAVMVLNPQWCLSWCKS